MYSFGSKVLGASAPKPPLIQFGYALISVLVRLTFTFGATFRHEEMLKVCPLKCKLADDRFHTKLDLSYKMTNIYFCSQIYSTYI